MSYRVILSRRADTDVAKIHAWIAKRSPRGALAWSEALFDAIHRLKDDAASHPLAPEAAKVGLPVRELSFKTRRGRKYRVVFLINGVHVRVLRIRGPGQRSLRRRDIGGRP